MKPFPDDVRFVGPLRPQRFEATVEDCIVEGEIPKDLYGGFYRTSPTFKRHKKQPGYGMMASDRMVQGLILENGQATYRNRWVRTPKYMLEEAHGEGLFEWHDAWPDYRGETITPVRGNGSVTDGVPAGSNTVNAVPYYAKTGNVVLACNEILNVPIALDPMTLETLGPIACAGQMVKGYCGEPTFTAHPKWDPETGVIFGATSGEEAPYVTVQAIHPDGTVKSKAIENEPFRTSIHDIWLTKDHVAVPYTGWHYDSENAKAGGAPMHWKPENGVTIALVPRDLESPVKWIKSDFPGEYILHTLSANTSDNKITLNGPVYKQPPFGFDQFNQVGSPYIPLYAANNGHWVCDLDSGTLSSEVFDDRPCEFPKIDERFFGKPYQHGFMLGGDTLYMLDTLIHYNVRSGEEKRLRIVDPEEHDKPVGLAEPVFVPRHASAAEGDGYMLLPVSWFTDHLSEYWLLDTEDITQGPIAKVKMPFQMGWSTHGHWMDFANVPGKN
ncbi:MAG: carotenoid oxygenase family protein [Gammaproteobacteria bacterium]|nr:carotenoid oxygenase family protein [Gammaproteobacteria bacterium]MDE0273844.1 carotenoid oxygenase family protein [Gammaproteobacteria bacterium]